MNIGKNENIGKHSIQNFSSNFLGQKIAQVGNEISPKISRKVSAIIYEHFAISTRFYQKLQH